MSRQENDSGGLPRFPTSRYALVVGMRGVVRTIAFVAFALSPACAFAQGLYGIGYWRASAAAIAAATGIAFAVWGITRAARFSAQADIARSWGLRMRGLLTTVPSTYLIVSQNGTASCSDALRAWLGLNHRVTALDDLAPTADSGLDGEDFQALCRDITALGVSGIVFSQPVRVVGSNRVLLAQGRAAPPEVAGEQGVVVWFSDATEAQAAIEMLREEGAALGAQLDATTALIEVAPFPIWRRGPDMRLSYVNAAYVNAVQADSAESVVENGIELVNNALSATSRAAARRAYETGRPHLREEPVIIGSSRRMLQIADVPLDGQGVGGFAIDVTDRDDARAERDRFQQAQTETLDRLSAGVALFAADHSLAFYNKPFCNLFQLDPAWLDERPEFDRVLERMREARRVPEQRDFPSWRRARRAWFTDATQPIEETWALPDSHHIRVIAQPHPAGGLLMVFEDRTEQLRLASSRDTLLSVQAATLNNLHEAVAVFGADGRLQLSNTRFAQIWHLDPTLLDSKPHIDDLLALIAHRFVDPDLAMRVREVLQATTGSDRRTSHTSRLELVDGAVFEFAAVPLPDGNALFTYMDVTDSQRIQAALQDRADALEAADRLKSAFVANVSYELRTPLTAISGFAEMLAAGYAGLLTEQQGEYVSSILTSSDRLQLLIDDILDLAITETGEPALDMTMVAIEPLARAVVVMTEEAAQSRGLTIDVDIAKDIGLVEGDERRLKQVLYNLLTNAVRFTPPGGRITLDAAADARELCIVVSDTGIGITPDEQPFVFDRFWKGSNASSQGVGLGLALVRQFVDLHGGHVELRSEPGQGTRVTVRLPRRQPVAERAVAE